MQFKVVKQDLEKVFNTILQATSNAELPKEEDVAHFVRLSRLMHGQAEEEWVYEAEDFLHLATQFQMAVKNKELQDAILIVESLDDARSYCHRTLNE